MQPGRITVRDLLIVLFTKIHVLLCFFFVITCGMAAYLFYATPVYQVSASVLVKPLFKSTSQLKRPNNFWVAKVTQEDINNEIEIMKSDDLIKDLVEELGLSENEIDPSAQGKKSEAGKMILKIKKKFKIKPVTLSNLIEIKLKGSDPEEITKMMDTFLKIYVDYHIKAHKSKDGLGFYLSQTKLYHDKLEKSEDDLKKFKEKWSIVDIETQKKELIKLHKVLDEMLSRVRVRISEQKSRFSLLKKDIEKNGRITAKTEDIRKDQSLKELTKLLIPLLVEYQRISQLYPETSVEVLNISAQVKKFEQEMRVEEKKIVKGMKFDLAPLVNQEKTIMAEIKRVEKISALLTEKETELERLMRKVDNNKEIYELYYMKSEEARILNQKEKLRVSNISIVNRPIVPSGPVYPRKVLMGILAVIIGFLTGTGFAFLFYYLDDSIKTPEDLMNYCKVPFLAQLKKIKY